MNDIVKFLKENGYDIKYSETRHYKQHPSFYNDGRYLITDYIVYNEDKQEIGVITAKIVGRKYYAYISDGNKSTYYDIYTYSQREFIKRFKEERSII